MRFGHGASTLPRNVSPAEPTSNVSSSSRPETFHERSAAPTSVTTARCPGRSSTYCQPLGGSSGAPSAWTPETAMPCESALATDAAYPQRARIVRPRLHAMHLRKLGRTGLEVSEVGFGGWGIGGTGWIGAEDDESLQALNRAIDL